MKQQKLTTLILFLASAMTCLYSCKKDDNSGDNNNTTKTLDKAKLVGKKWYNESGTYTHDIRANNVYSSGGTWQWKNNSDTMIVDLDGSGSVHPSIEWKFFWSSDHEMACRQVGTGTSEILFKDQPW
jgi:hypothetical protein